MRFLAAFRGLHVSGVLNSSPYAYQKAVSLVPANQVTSFSLGNFLTDRSGFCCGGCARGPCLYLG